MVSLYPNKIFPSKIKKSALSYKSLPGLYWHYWGEVNLSDWEVLIVDPSINDQQRALIISSRDQKYGRIVISSLTLDWQKQRSILQNILTYVVEGKHNTALLSNEDNKNTAFDYLLGTLQSRKYPFKSYFLGQDLNMLKQHITNHVHNILVLGPFVDKAKLPEKLKQEIDTNVLKGNLKLISVDGTDSETSRFSVSGRERSALKLLHTAELQIQSELRTGYIDGSFWNTAETLQILQSLEPSEVSYKDVVGEALSMASKHDRNGSYDEVFGVSCAFLWMRGAYLGVDHSKTIESIKWVRERVAEYEPREQIQAYVTLSELGISTPDETEAITSILTRSSTELLSEIDIVVYLKASLISDNRPTLPSLVTTLNKSQRENGSWVDLATTATAVATLIDVLITMRSDAALYSQLKPNIESMVFKGIIHIQNSLQSPLLSANIQSYPWDGKASTTAKCIQAWLKFEELIDLPVYELVEVLAKYDIQTSSLSLTRQALSILEDIKKDNNNISNELVDIRKKLVAESKVAHLSRIYLLIGIVVIYIFFTFVFGSWNTLGSTQILKLFKTSFIDAWTSHLAVMGATAALLALPIRKWLKDTK